MGASSEFSSEHFPSVLEELAFRLLEHGQSLGGCCIATTSATVYDLSRRGEHPLVDHRAHSRIERAWRNAITVFRELRGEPGAVDWTVRRVMQHVKSNRSVQELVHLWKLSDVELRY
jgi:hypothetical protein